MFRRGMKEETSLWKSLLLAFLVALAGNAIAQDTATDEDEDDATEMVDEEEADLGKIVVTGSRLQRETYTSISPMQVITAEGSREVGLIDTADILQTATASAGQQIDLTFQGFVLDNGPGASTVNLRGLGEQRTLVLLNGRRLAPSGVEGVPQAPNLNLIPASLVQQYDLLLDGASSIYGSDAVAGVTNILLRKDFDGFEFDVYYNSPDQKNGDSYTASALWGKNYARGFIGVGVELQDREAVRYGDRSWTEGCEKHYEFQEGGGFRTEEQFYNNVYGMRWDECRLGLLAGRVSVPGAFSIYRTPGFSNGGWLNWSESEAYGFAIDSDQDGMADITYRDYDLNGSPSWQNSHLFAEQSRTSIMAYGEYTFDGEMNNTPFFEVLYNDRDFYSVSQGGQLFPNVPGTNPYNICNPDAITGEGVDCGLAYDALLQNPGYRADFLNTFEGFCSSIGLPASLCVPETFGLDFGGPIGPARTQPITSVIGDRNTTDVTEEQYRVVVGLKGDLPFFNAGPMSSWIYETSLSFTETDATSTIPGIRRDRLEYALGWYSNTFTPCDGSRGVTAEPRNPGEPLASDTADGCVPVNLFAASLYPDGVRGDFATQAERDYVFDNRVVDTTYQQTVFAAYANGFLWDLPGGPMTAGFGLEWREDDIRTVPNANARDGLFFGFYKDRGANGAKDTFEIFGEMELPILADLPGAEEVTVNLSGRWTDDEIYGSDTTYSAKLGWRPIESLLIRGTIGTSFRAPNVREVFLGGISGFTTVTDPCAVPEAALGIDGSYIPEQDRRDPVVLENCRRTGVDPTTLISGTGNTAFSTEVFRAGRTDLEAETSDSITYGFAFEQPWFDTFFLTFGATYYDIKVSDTIIEPSGAFVVSSCYNDEQFDSVFCDDITRGSDGFFDFLDLRFLNRDSSEVRGIDFNINFDKTFQVGERGVGLGIDMVVNHGLENSDTFVSSTGVADYDDDQGEFGYPDWSGQIQARVNISDFRFTWSTRYIGEVEQDPAGIDGFGDIFGSTGFLADTCSGPPDDGLCRDWGAADDYYVHSASLYYYGDSWTIGAGIRNVFDEEPPQVDGTEILSYNNTPIGYGYDLMGRTYFMNVVWRPGF